MHPEIDWCEMQGVEEPPLPGGAVWQPPPHMGLITAHFSYAEAVCRHCGRIPGVPAVQETAEWMESVRAALGGRPIHVTSWCRCSLHNAAVGGAPNSFHLRGWALDFVVEGLTVKGTQGLLRPHQGPGKLIGGMGTYTSWTHCDRGPARRWNGP